MRGLIRYMAKNCQQMSAIWTNLLNSWHCGIIFMYNFQIFNVGIKCHFFCGNSGIYTTWISRKHQIVEAYNLSSAKLAVQLLSFRSNCYDLCIVDIGHKKAALNMGRALAASRPPVDVILFTFFVCFKLFLFFWKINLSIPCFVESSLFWVFLK